MTPLTSNPNKAFLLLGGNEGNRIELLREAISQLNSSVGTVINFSSVYETEPWGFEAVQNFLNMVVLAETEKTAPMLLDTCLSIENNLGRKRLGKEGYASRTMDIDILFFNSDIINLPNLQIPHKLLQERRFVLKPLAEIAPSFIHPSLKKTITQLLDECQDNSDVKFFCSI